MQRVRKVLPDGIEIGLGQGGIQRLPAPINEIRMIGSSIESSYLYLRQGLAVYALRYQYFCPVKEVLEVVS